MTFDPTAITTLQTELTRHWHEVEPAAGGEDFLKLVQENHLRNFQLWHEEDVARRDDLGSERVHQAKRAIDRYNQERNNFIEEMDKLMVAELKPAESGVPKNSETPGMIIDRLSILALKEFHMAEETVREDASAEHRENCGAKLARILHQRSDLTQCLGELLQEVTEGRRTFGVYYQFKMYNDPALNPQLYGGAKS
ncbi:DUF4254 domain-containing protein [Luteolibacter pohnpeiensis]|uniref:DUF4254 domain-containing protein n=1 Tax=Luteolibacter pohnpeiensis TaxID=454153 RepID=A0A934SA88_9BACT|nr:DUF4254 domain-containing protein [Luteolibacter pohnpeiensis]MBK1882507.1 DUF4254 domain-containing protein [Luteolibacter pohnpeiensis]